MSKRDAVIYRRAARYMERNGRGVEYPCIAVQQFAQDGSCYARNAFTRRNHAERFIIAMCPGKTEPLNGETASNRYITRLVCNSTKGRAHSILALCFAAALAETGDL